MRKSQKPLSANDRREIRQFVKYLQMKEKQPLVVLTDPAWQKYLGLTPEEAEKLAEMERELHNPPEPESLSPPANAMKCSKCDGRGWYYKPHAYELPPWWMPIPDDYAEKPEPIPFGKYTCHVCSGKGTAESVPHARLGFPGRERDRTKARERLEDLKPAAASEPFDECYGCSSPEGCRLNGCAVERQRAADTTPHNWYLCAKDGLKTCDWCGGWWEPDQPEPEGPCRKRTT